MNCAEVEDLRDLFVLGTLTADEADAVEEHLIDCRECRSRIDESWQAAQVLRRAVGQHDPSPAVRAALFEAIGRELEEERKITLLPARAPRRVHVPWRAARAAAIAASVPLLVSGWLVVQVLNLQNQVATAERARTQTLQTGFTAMEVLGKAVEHGGGMASLRGTDMAPTASGTFYFMPGEREAVLMVSGLPKLTKGQVYQLWLVHGDETMTGGTFYCEPDGSGMLVVKAPMPVTAVDALRITAEPHGGSAAPAGDRYLWGTMEKPRAT
jgi:anti-sigma-K factor RskA